MRSLSLMILPLCISAVALWLMDMGGWFVTLNWIGIPIMLISSMVGQVLSTSKKNVRDRAGLLIGVIVVKMLVSLIILVIYAWLYTTSALHFAIAYISQYMIFTIFDIIHFRLTSKTT